MRGESSPWIASTPYDLPSPNAGQSWFIRATAISSSWFALAGYTLFSLVVGSSPNNLEWSEDVIGSLGGIFLVIGYMGGVIAYYFSKTLAFRLDAVVLPLLLASIGGLFEVVVNYALHTTSSVSMAYVYIPLTLSCVTTVLCGGLALFTNTKLRIMKSVEASRKRHMDMVWETPNTGTTPYQYSQQTTAISPHQPPPTESTELRPITVPTMNIPEDEAQRRQLLRLLIQREEQEQDSGTEMVIAPVNTGASSTYKIDWQGEEDSPANVKTSFLPPPVAQGHGRSRSGSLPDITNKWSIHNLLGGGGKKKMPITRIESREEIRERRRLEIEQGSLSRTATSPRPDQGLLSSRYSGGEA